MTNNSQTPVQGSVESGSLKDLQKQVDLWIRSVGVRYFNELTNTAILMEEVGELARIMARSYGEQSFKEGESAESLADEMADILWVLICLANQTGVNLDDAFQKNLQKKSSRDAHRHHNNPKLSTS
jgi:NTP pyrophosphatase (non-canonical NTP hydrolase)